MRSYTCALPCLAGMFPAQVGAICYTCTFKSAGHRGLPQLICVLFCRCLSELILGQQPLYNIAPLGVATAAVQAVHSDSAIANQH